MPIPAGKDVFVRAMNAKARALGMTQTHFDDPSGLSIENVSSARDLAKLVIAASHNATIREYSTSRKHEVRVGPEHPRVSQHQFAGGEPSWTITVQKTGFINEAGECLVMPDDDRGAAGRNGAAQLVRQVHAGRRCEAHPAVDGVSATLAASPA
ncbi:MAG: hypothetical protein WDO68_19490 [Gammaproteobacteria bacterium]